MSSGVPPIPYAPARVYDPSNYSMRIADLIMRRGDVLARGQAASGQIWGNAINQIGQIAANYAQQRYERGIQSQEGQAVAGLLQQANQDPNFDLGAALKKSGLPAERYQSVITAYDQANSAAANVSARRAQMQELQLKMAQQQQAYQQSIIDTGATLMYHASQHAGEDGGLDSMSHALAFAKARGIPGVDQIEPIVQQRMQAYQQAQQSGDPNALAKAVSDNRSFMSSLTQQFMTGASPQLRESLVKEATAGQIKLGPGESIVQQNVPGLTGGGGVGPSVVASAPPKLEKAEGLLVGGKSVSGSYNPLTGEYSYQGQPVSGEKAPPPKDPLAQEMARLRIQDERKKLTDAAQDKEFLVKGLLAGNLSAQDLGRAQNRADVLAGALKQEPGFSTQTYKARAKMRDDFANSSPNSAGGQMDSLNQLAGHLQVLKGLYSALQNGNAPAVNAIVNKVRDQLGAPSVNNADTASLAVAEEMARLLKGGVAAEGEGDAWLKRFRSAGSMAQQEGAVQTVEHLVKGRIDAKRQRWNAVMGKDNSADFDSYITDEAKQMYGVGSSGKKADPLGIR